MGYHNEFYTAEVQGPYELYDAGRFELEDGGVIPNLQLAYATHGTLNEARDNAILIPTWYSGTHQTWEQVYIGPGRALDPEHYFIVIINQIGNGLSTSPHNAAEDAIAMSRFPKVRIAMMFGPRNNWSASCSVSPSSRWSWAGRWALSRPTNGPSGSPRRSSGPHRWLARPRTLHTTSCSARR